MTISSYVDEELLITSLKRNEAEYMVHSNLLLLQSHELLKEVKCLPVPLIDKAIDNIKKILLKPSG